MRQDITAAGARNSGDTIPISDYHTPAPHVSPHKNYNKRGEVEFQNGRFSSARWYDAAGRLGSLQFEPVPYGPGHFLDYSFAYNPVQKIVTLSTSTPDHVGSKPLPMPTPAM